MRGKTRLYSAVHNGRNGRKSLSYTSCEACLAIDLERTVDLSFISMVFCSAAVNVICFVVALKNIPNSSTSVSVVTCALSLCFPHPELSTDVFCPPLINPYMTG